MRILRKIKNFIIGSFIITLALILIPISRLLLSNKNIWIITERPQEARDNGYIFFKYLSKNRPNVNCFYAIDFKSSDYEKVKSLGKCLRFGSLHHLFYFCGAKYLVSTTTQYFCPSYFLTLLRQKISLPGKYIFLQHGITKDDLPFLYSDKQKIDLFICGANPEYEWVKNKFNYQERAVLTGFSRFDSYFDIKTKNQILIMPTWRREAEKNFENSQYYSTYFNLLNSSELENLLSRYGYHAYFYVHPLFQKYSSLFKTKNRNVTICNFNDFDVQELLKESKLLITDFSSVFFDFAYMKKPIIYYQYDEDTFFEKHYAHGYFSYRKNGFGSVVNDSTKLLEELESLLADNCNLPEKYQKRINSFFTLIDQNNSERIYEEIIKL